MALADEDPVEAAKNAVQTPGFYINDDATIGQQVQEKKQARFPCWSNEGLDFLDRNVITDKVFTTQISVVTDLTIS